MLNPLRTARRSLLPGRAAVSALASVLAAVIGLSLLGTPAAAAPAAASYDFYAGYLGPGATSRSCFHFNHAQSGPVLVSATARAYNVVIKVVSTDLENRTNYGWTYCTTLRNESTVGAGVDVAARAELSAQRTFDTSGGYIAAGATQRHCFHYSHGMYGAVAVSAAAAANDVILTTVSTDLENRLGYGWTYCATVRNASAKGTNYQLMTRSALASTNQFNYYAGFLNAGATARYCFNYPPNVTPVAVAAAATHLDAVLTTVSTDREDRFNYGRVYCATIKNSSAIGTGVSLQTRAGF